MWADEDLLRRAMANLMNNALRYGAKEKAIQLDCYLKHEQFVIQVSN
ncbi:ATP-binding protein [Oceanisphaera pacifica]|uniref:ATP-binding protein n=1 Tax=Oceanisphaera pacifica TaxID=2818389 RepID=A0ABS3NDH3_9GAMM|nr:ATP-binding protein [Oceanisphaera pacifica]MBO1518325.1 ATP-binding protein [Oceanisphaera pacifica]